MLWKRRLCEITRKLMKKNLKIIFSVYTILLPVISYIVSPPLKAFLGVSFVLLITIIWGKNLGIVAAIWSSLIALSGNMFFAGLPTFFIVAGIIIYFTIALGLGYSIDVFRKQEKALQESEERYRSLVDTVPEIIVKIDNKGRFLWANENGMNFFGNNYLVYYFADYFINKNTRKDFKENKQELVEGNKDFLQFEALMYRQDGKKRLLEWNCKAVRLDGEFANIIATARDISEYRQIEKEKEKLLAIIDRSPAVALIWKNEEDWPVEFISKNIEQFGYQAEDFASKQFSYLNIVHPEDREPILDLVNEYIAKKQERYELVYRIISKNGDIRWVKDWTWDLYDKAGNCIWHEGIVLDITELKEAEEDLANEKERLAVTLRSIGDGVIATDNNGKIVLINEVAERLTAWREEEAKNKPLGEVFHIINEKTGKVCENPVAKVLETGEVIGLANHTALIAKDGQEYSIADSAAPIYDENKNVIGVVLVFRDVTEQKQIEEQKAVLFAQTKQSLAESQSLMRLTSALLQKISLEEVLEIVCKESLQLTKAQGSSVFLKEEDYLSVAFSIGKASPAFSQLPLEGSLTGLAVKTGQAVLSNEQIKDKRRYHDKQQQDEPKNLLAVPLKSKEEIIGALVVVEKEEEFNEEDSRIISLFANQASVAIENAKLYKQVQELAVVKERQRLARDLHDAVTQTLFSASLIAEVIPKLWDKNQEEAKKRLEELRQLTRGALAEMRTLLLELRPSGLTKVSLKELLSHLADVVIGRARLPVVFKVEGDIDLPPDVQIAFYRIAQEALNNIVKHARASEAKIELKCQPEQLTLTISDNGCGFDPSNLSPNNLGLGIMEERAKEIAASFKITSQAKQGTTIKVVWVPTKELKCS